MLSLFLRYLHFCPDFFTYIKKLFEKKLRKNQTLMTSQDGTQTITINILLDISKSKDNQNVKFGQLIEYNVRNIFL